MTIFALTIPCGHDRQTVWAFDMASEYYEAQAHLLRHGVPHVCHHAFDRTGRICHASDDQRSDADWIKASMGVNDADEVERLIYQNGLARESVPAMNPANSFRPEARA